jgi:hypothetical protein
MPFYHHDTVLRPIFDLLMHKNHTVLNQQQSALSSQEYDAEKFIRPARFDAGPFRRQFTAKKPFSDSILPYAKAGRAGMIKHGAIITFSYPSSRPFL